MKKAFSFLIFFILNNGLFAQDSLSLNTKLETTAKIWGFLKYYHPIVAEGKYNWDQELFNVLPKVKEAKTKIELSQVYLEWIAKLGEVKNCKKCKDQNDFDYFNKNFDLSWINNKSLFTSELSTKLKFIEVNRHQGKKNYVAEAHKRIRNIEVTNEELYGGYDWKDENLRLLTLFRYWNIIEYFFPYKYQTDTPWEEVLIQMIPKFLNPKDEIDLHLAMLELVTNIDDGHGVFVSNKTNEYFGLYWISGKFKLIEGKAIITGFYNDSLASLNDLKIGDVITKINGKEVGLIFKERMKYIAGSNLPRKQLYAYYAVFNGSTDSVEIEFIRDSKHHNRFIKRYLFKDFGYSWDNQSLKYEVLKDNIGYVNMGALKIKDVPTMMDSLKNTKAIIFDIRNYPKGTMYAIANYISSSKNDFYKVIYPDLDYPGRFIWKEGHQCGGNGKGRYTGKVILLVDESTQSHAEFTTMALQTGDNVTTIGGPSSGADGNVSIFKMVGGYKTMISGIGIFYPDKTETQRKGVKVDIEIRPTIQGIIDGRDEVLEKAIEFINEKEG